MTSMLGRDERRATRKTSGPSPQQVRLLLGLATRPSGITIVLMATVVVVVLVVANSDLTGTYGAVAAVWLAVHQVPLTISGAALGVLPLLPTAVMVWMVARGCAAAITGADRVITTQELLRVVGAAVGGPLVVTAIALAVIYDASTVIPLSPPGTPAALAGVVAVHLLGAVIGLRAVLWRKVTARLGVAEWALAAVRPGGRAVMVLLVSGAVLTTVSLVWSWATVGALLERDNGVMGVCGLTVLSVLYLPNVMVGAAAVVTGSSVQFGDGSLSLFHAVGGKLPPLPVLGAIPAGPAAPYWPLLLAIPLTAGAVLGRDVARGRSAAADRAPDGTYRRHAVARDTLLTVLAAAGGAGVVLAVLSLVGGGRLGVFGTVGANSWLFGLLTFAWIGLPGVLTALLVVWREGRADDDGSVVSVDGETGDAADAVEFELKSIEAGPAAAPDPTTAPGGETVLDAEIVEDGTDATSSGAGGPVDIVDAEVEEEPERVEDKS